MDKTTEKTTVTIPEETVEWLTQTYPDALSLQEAVRMAISDARASRGSQKTLPEIEDN